MARKSQNPEYKRWNSSACTRGFGLSVPYISHLVIPEGPNPPHISEVAANPCMEPCSRGVWNREYGPAHPSQRLPAQFQLSPGSVPAQFQRSDMAKLLCIRLLDVYSTSLSSVVACLRRYSAISVLAASRRRRIVAASLGASPASAASVRSTRRCPNTRAFSANPSTALLVSYQCASASAAIRRFVQYRLPVETSGVVSRR